MEKLLAWIASNYNFVTTIISIVRNIVTDLEQIHGLDKLTAWAQAILNVVDSVFKSLGANTGDVSPTVQATIDKHTDQIDTTPVSSNAQAI